MRSSERTSGTRVNGTHLTLRRQRISRQRPIVVPSFWFCAPHQNCKALTLAAFVVEDYFAQMKALPNKSELRNALRKVRREHVAAQSDAIRALPFNRPPAPLVESLPAKAVIGLYHSTPHEAPAGGYARFFHDVGHTIALPHFDGLDAPMAFRVHSDPHGESDLEPGPFDLKQPSADAAEITPDVLFVPLVGFTVELARLGQGGGHYDRWLVQNPGVKAIGMAWDAQLVETLPTEPHDMALDAVVTPTRLYGLI